MAGEAQPYEAPQAEELSNDGEQLATAAIVATDA